MNSQLAEAQALQKEIRDMELELARTKATYPSDNVCLLPRIDTTRRLMVDAENDNGRSERPT
jgi:hypothetical protein